MPIATTLQESHRAIPSLCNIWFQIHWKDHLSERGERIISSRIGERRNLTRKVPQFWEPP